MTEGRSVDEILRLVKDMQTSDAHKVATQENWQADDKVIVPPPGSVEEAWARFAADEYECVDWCFYKNRL